MKEEAVRDDLENTLAREYGQKEELNEFLLCELKIHSLKHSTHMFNMSVNNRKTHDTRKELVLLLSLFG